MFLFLGTFTSTFVSLSFPGAVVCVCHTRRALAFGSSVDIYGLITRDGGRNYNLISIVYNVRMPDSVQPRIHMPLPRSNDKTMVAKKSHHRK